MTLLRVFAHRFTRQQMVESSPLFPGDGSMLPQSVDSSSGAGVIIDDPSDEYPGLYIDTETGLLMMGGTQ